MDPGNARFQDHAVALVEDASGDAPGQQLCCQDQAGRAGPTTRTWQSGRAFMTACHRGE